MNESEDFHPIVAKWLEENGYTFEHEVSLPLGGRVDFIAHKQGEKTLVIECKTSGAGMHRIVGQVHAYQVQVPDSNLAIAIPKGTCNQTGRELCRKGNIRLIEVDVSDEEIHQRKKARGATNPFWIEFGLSELFRKDPELALHAIINHCRQHRTPVAIDLVNGLRITEFLKAERVNPFLMTLRLATMDLLGCDYEEAEATNLHEALLFSGSGSTDIIDHILAKFSKQMISDEIKAQSYFKIGALPASLIELAWESQKWGELMYAAELGEAPGDDLNDADSGLAYSFDSAQEWFEFWSKKQNFFYQELWRKWNEFEADD